MDNQEIGDIINRKSDDVPEPVAEQPKQDAPSDEKGNRDERGRFVAKEDKAEQPDPPPQPTGEAKQADAPPAPAQSQPPHGYVPTAALIDQRLEARQWRQRAEEAQRRVEELSKPKPEPIDFYADPDGAFNQRIDPLAQKFERTISNLTLRASKAEAIAIHGKKTVDDMEAAIGNAMESGDPEIMQLRNAMLTSDDPVGIAMNWYQRRKVLTEVGPDPVAYREKIKAEILAEMQGGQPAAQQQAAPVMPSNLAGARNVGTRSGPQWSGPPKLDDIFKR
jgi:hypothetical protein